MKIAAIIPTWNRPGELERALESVRFQTRLPDEIAVIGDKCHPRAWQDSMKIVKRFQKLIKGPRWILHNLQHPGRDWGATPRNYALMHSLSEIVAYLDDDNEWHVTHLDIMEKALVKSGADLVHCGMDLICLDGTRGVNEAPDVPAFQKIDTSEIMHTRACLALLKMPFGLWWRNHIYACDWDLVDRLMKSGAKTHPVKKALTTYHVRKREDRVERRKDVYEQAFA